MLKPQQILGPLFFMFILMGCKVNRYSQDTFHKIVVDTSIRDSLVNEVHLDTIGQHILGRLFFHINKTYDIDEFVIPNASDVTYFLQVQQLLNKPFMEAVCECNLLGDSIVVSGGQGYYAGGVAFKISLFDNKSTGQIRMQTAKNVYKLEKGKGEYLNDVILPLSKLDIVIQQKPAYKLNEQIRGKALLVTDPFYQLNNRQEPHRMQLEFIVEFGCLVDD